jgi:hypothetical protein
MSDKVIFNLKRFWEIDGKTVNLYEEIKAGRKTSEWRECSYFWDVRLLTDFFKVTEYIRGRIPFPPKDTTIDLTKFLKKHKAWFVEGYPKNNSPRLEADITKLRYWWYTGDNSPQFEIQFNNIKEVIIPFVTSYDKTVPKGEK